MFIFWYILLQCRMQVSSIFPSSILCGTERKSQRERERCWPHVAKDSNILRSSRNLNCIMQFLLHFWVSLGAEVFFSSKTNIRPPSTEKEGEKERARERGIVLTLRKTIFSTLLSWDFTALCSFVAPSYIRLK
jgi:hypothetical protein